MSQNHDALRRIYEQTAGYATAVCSRYLTRREDIEDALQETYLKAFSSLGRFIHRSDSSTRAWIARIAANESVNILRERNRLSFVQAEEKIPDIEDTGPDMEGISQEDMIKAIQSLPDGYRTIFNLYVFEDMSHAQIASLLGISESTSSSQFTRAKARLAKTLRQQKQQ